LNDGVLTEATRFVTDTAMADYSPLVLHSAGSLLVAMYGATIGKLAMLDFPATVNQACCVVTPAGSCSAQFLFYWLLAFRQELIEMGRGSGQPNISQETLRAIRIAIPSADEQRKIVRRVGDWRERLIDVSSALVEQIALLQERKEALITGAVTGQFAIPGVVT
jgi:type I restriction enzyme S subunit